MRRTRRRLLTLLLFALAVCLVGCVDAQELPQEPQVAGVKLTSHVADWRDEVIYQVIVDRFHDGDVNNNYNVDTRAMARYHGGDWQGLIDKLDYLQALGVTTLWITPVVKNVEEDAGFSSYHGYWTQHFTKHNPHFGELHDLRRLSDALHDRDMKLILDVVTNHVGQVFFYDVNGNGRPDEFLSGSTSADDAEQFARIERISEYDPDFDPRQVQARTGLGESGLAPIIFFNAPEINRVATEPRNIDLDGDGVIAGADEVLGFSNPTWYHRMGRVTEWDVNPPAGYIQGIQTLFGDFPGGLKDIATELPAVRKAMKLSFSYWIDVANADGFRIDTLKHVEYEFWEDWAPAMRQHAAARGKQNFFMFGEVFDGRDDLLGTFTGPDQVDSVFYFSQKFQVFDNLFKCAPGNEAAFCRNADGSYRYGTTSAVESLYQARLANYSAIPQPGGAVDAQGNGVAPQNLLVNFIDNHDVPRYLYERPDARGISSLHNALFYLLTEDGIPCLYYGTEQAFFGGNDPANREDMNVPSFSRYSQRADGYDGHELWDQNNPTFLHIQRLLRLRKQHTALRRGLLELTWTSDHVGGESDAGILAFERATADERALVVINTHEAQESSTQYTDPNDPSMSRTLQTGFPGGTELVDVFATDQPAFTVAADGTLLVSVPALSGRVLVPRANAQP